MADVLSSSCDICGEIKREANHWYRVYLIASGGGIVIVPWNHAASPKEHQHACGEDHALKLAARLLGKLTALADPGTGQPSEVAKP